MSVSDRTLDAGIVMEVRKRRRTMTTAEQHRRNDWKSPHREPPHHVAARIDGADANAKEMTSSMAREKMGVAVSCDVERLRSKGWSVNGLAKRFGLAECDVRALLGIKGL